MLGFKENLILVILFGALIFIAAFTVSRIKKQGAPSNTIKNEKNCSEEGKQSSPIRIMLPISGRIIPLSELEDPAFSSGALGDGCAVIPSEGRVFSPASGRIAVMPSSRHAIGIHTSDGCDILIHVGRDTVSLEGKHFTPYCSVGDSVSVGDLLLVFDSEGLVREGYDIKTPIIISESEKYKPFSPLCKEKAENGDLLFELFEKK